MNKDDDNTEHIKKLFNGIADWDESIEKISAMMGNKSFDEYDQNQLLEMFKDIGNNKGGILDAGCGIGRNFGVFKGAGYSRIVGVDISEGMLRVCKKNHPDKELYCFDIEKIDFPDNTFECVIACNVLVHVFNDKKAGAIINELERVSKGRVIIGQCMQDRFINEGGLGGKVRPSKKIISMFKTKNIEKILKDWSITQQLTPSEDGSHKLTYIVMGV